MLIVHRSSLRAIKEHYERIFMRTLTQLCAVVVECTFHLLPLSAVLPIEASWESGDAVRSRRAKSDRNVATACGSYLLCETLTKESHTAEELHVSLCRYWRKILILNKINEFNATLRTYDVIFLTILEMVH